MTFIKSAVIPDQYPFIMGKKEIAVVGRSNVGKSSLINHFLGIKGLARISATPGKTQLINFFVTKEFSLADLPGYGFAKVPLHMKKSWGPMIEEYLKSRTALGRLLFLLDIRHLPTSDDLILWEWIKHHKCATTIILTKADKLKESQINSHRNDIMEVLGRPDCPSIIYSIKSGTCRKELMNHVTK